MLYSLYVSAVSGRDNNELLKSALEAIKTFSNLVHNKGSADDEEREEDTVTEEDLLSI